MHFCCCYCTCCLLFGGRSATAGATVARLICCFLLASQPLHSAFVARVVDEVDDENEEVVTYLCIALSVYRLLSHFM